MGRWDIGGLSTNIHPQTERPTVFVYDGHPGGVGIAERGFEDFEGWVADTADLLAGCPCAEGCPPGAWLGPGSRRGRARARASRPPWLQPAAVRAALESLRRRITAKMMSPMAAHAASRTRLTRLNETAAVDPRPNPRNVTR